MKRPTTGRPRYDAIAKATDRLAEQRPGGAPPSNAGRSGAHAESATNGAVTVVTLRTSASPALSARTVELLNELAIGHDWTRTERADGSLVMEKTTSAGRQLVLLLQPPGGSSRKLRRRLV